MEWSHFRFYPVLSLFYQETKFMYFPRGIAEEKKMHIFVAATL